MKDIVDELLSCGFTSQPLDVKHYVEMVKTVIATRTRTIVALSTISYGRASDESFHQELEQIQNVIDRQASNSFKIKGWTVTLVVVALLFRTNNFQLFAAFIPLIGFWYLDAYYLKQERRFRELYNWVRHNRPDNEDHLFDMDPSRVDGDVDSTARLMLNNSLLWFYGTVGGLLILYSAILIFINGGTIFG